MKNKFQRLIVLFSVFLLLLGSAAFPVFADVKPVRYVALGDSLSAGQTPFKELGKGFTGMIAEHLQAAGLLDSYSNAFAVPGYTTKHVLEDLLNNVEKSGSNIQDVIKDATVITITAGANDFIGAADIDIEKGTISIEPQTVISVSQTINQNLSKLVKEINRLAPEADIYIFGYYNAFPYLSEEQQPLINQALGAMNGAIQHAALENGATYVALDGIFNDDIPSALPNPTDIHPSLEGYEKMAEAFMKAFFTKQATFEDVPDTNWAADYIQFVVANNIMSGKSATHFGASESITRAETAQTLINLLILDMSMPPDPGFNDVTEAHKNYYAIAKLTQVGIFEKADAFNPDAALTRAEMAKVLAVALRLEPTKHASFNDVPATHWATPYINALVSENITTGYPDNTFKPAQETTRAEFAAFLTRAVKQKLH